MDNLMLALESAWRVLVVGLAFGAGLPAVFALGIRAMAWGAGGDAEISHERPHPVGRVLAALAFGIVIAGVVLGLTMIVAGGFGKDVTFDRGFPAIVDE